MSQRILSDGTTRQLEQVIQQYADRGIAIDYDYLPEDALVSIVVREVEPAFSRHHTESELWDLAVSAFRFVSVLKEIRAVPLHSHVIEVTQGKLVFRRLVTPEFDCEIHKGTGLYGFVIRDLPYHLETPPEFIHDHMEFFAKQARAAIERQGLIDKLP